MNKKSLGQHWLEDDATLEAICDAAAVTSGDVILEIGPGEGSLTTKLLSRGAEVIAVELDDDLISGLSRRFAGQAITIHHQSILDFNLNDLPECYKVVANIPYYLTSKLIRNLCESDNPFSEAVLLIQKEVAQRVAAEPGEMSILSVATQFYCEVGLGPVVGAELFTPPPKVDSQLLLLNYRGPKFDVNVKEFFRLVRAGFGERRKQLANSLSGGLGISKDRAGELIASCGFNPRVRAQELSLDEWYRLFLEWSRDQK